MLSSFAFMSRSQDCTMGGIPSCGANGQRGKGRGKGHEGRGKGGGEKGMRGRGMGSVGSG